MHPALLEPHVVHHRRRLLADAAVRRARPQPPPLRIRTSALRQSVGFRLVEAGLRLALAEGEGDLPKLRRSA